MADNEENKPKTSVQITLEDIYKMLQNTHERLVSLENDMKNKMGVNGIPSDIDDFYKKINHIHTDVTNLEKKIDSHTNWSEGESHGTIQTHKLWIKVLSGIIAILAILQAIALFG